MPDNALPLVVAGLIGGLGTLVAHAVFWLRRRKVGNAAAGREMAAVALALLQLLVLAMFGLSAAGPPKGLIITLQEPSRQVVEDPKELRALLVTYHAALERNSNVVLASFFGLMLLLMPMSFAVGHALFPFHPKIPAASLPTQGIAAPSPTNA